MISMILLRYIKQNLQQMSSMIIAILVVLIHVVIIICFRLLNRNAELLLENARLFEENQELLAENERLLTEKAIKQNWSIGIPKPPNENSKQ